MEHTKLRQLLTPIALGTVFLFFALAILSPFVVPDSASAAAKTNTNLLSGIEKIVKKSPALQSSTVPSISNIIGATYDAARCEVIIFGFADPDLPPLHFSYMQ